MLPEMRTLLLRLRAVDRTAKPKDRVVAFGECQKAMDRAARLVGMSRVTHHDLRHLFATRCIESGVDVLTVSRWLGHKDGGMLAMRTYGHLRDEHSQEMAQKVFFIKVPATKPKVVAARKKHSQKQRLSDAEVSSTPNLRVL
jgi:integrase